MFAKHESEQPCDVHLGIKACINDGKEKAWTEQLQPAHRSRAGRIAVRREMQRSGPEKAADPSYINLLKAETSGVRKEFCSRFRHPTPSHPAFIRYLSYGGEPPSKDPGSGTVLVFAIGDIFDLLMNAVLTYDSRW